MRMVFDSMPELHKVLVDSCVKGMEEVKRIEGSIDSRDEEETGEAQTVIKSLQLIVSNSLWALSNLAAGPPYILD